MPQFKVGDRVKYVGGNANYSRSDRIGQYASVVEDWPNGHNTVRIRFDTPDPGHEFSNVFVNNIELVASFVPPPATTVTYPIEFKPLLDAAIAWASAQREQEAQRTRLSDAILAFEQARNEAAKL